MFEPATQALIAEKISTLPHMIMERSLRLDIGDLADTFFHGMKLAIVDDENTSRVFGDDVFKALAKRSVHITLTHPQADEETAAYINDNSQGVDAFIAVGSGTINDLCKLVSALNGKPYAVIPTAASMNGYLSVNASITRGGYKTTIPAQIPEAIWCDLSVIAGAPLRLSKAGLGDSLARPTAQADWLLSHLLLGTPYDDVPYTLLKAYEPQLFSQSRGIAKQDPASIQLLMNVLMLSGLGMSIAGGSYPASGGEHMIAHAMEMLLPDAPPSLHGEQIGITTLAMARRQETLMEFDWMLAPPDFNEEEIASLYGPKVAASAKEAYASKREKMQGAVLDKTMQQRIMERIAPIMMPSSALEIVLKEAEAPVVPTAIGWDMNSYQKASGTARYLRDRFTFLDII